MTLNLDRIAAEALMSVNASAGEDSTRTLFVGESGFWAIAETLEETEVLNVVVSVPARAYSSVSELGEALRSAM